MGAWFEAVGLDTVIANLKEIENEMVRKITVALKVGAMPIVNEAKKLAPYRTGNLRRSIHS